MINRDISEFSYGYAVTNELTTLNSSVGAAPYFPSLRYEGSKSGGFDVEIKFLAQPVFLQFKLSEFLMKKTAKEYSTFGSKYYRFKIWSSRQSDQHELLLELEKRYPCVYYVAPRFHTIEDLNTNYLNSNVIKNSIFVRPTKIGVIADDKEHCVAFRKDLFNGIMCFSEPKPIDIEDIGITLERMVNVPMLSYKFVEGLCSNMLSVLEEGGYWLPAHEFKNAMKKYDEDHVNDFYEKVRFLAQNFFGCELLFLIIPPKKNI